MPIDDGGAALGGQPTNWGRWGDDDQVGALNLVGSEQRRAAADLIRVGRTISLSRPFPVAPGAGNPRPAQHYMAINGDADGNGHAADFLGTYFHGHATTHLDALCHIWQDGLIWNGRRAVDSVDVRGASFGGIEHWANGIFTRGVLLDVPRHRGEPFVSEDRPVQAEELAEIARLDRLDIRPGDALAVYGGRAAFEVAHGPLGSTYATPGLHLSCLDFLREVDCSVLLWDLLDARPIADGHPWGVHAAIITLGIALVDNVALEPLAAACEEERRHDFALVVAPLPVVGGTGSPVNPLALL